MEEVDGDRHDVMRQKGVGEEEEEEEEEEGKEEEVVSVLR